MTTAATTAIATGGAVVAIRSAETGEAEALTELAFRSKAFWGYDAAFVEGCRPALAVTREQVLRHPVRAALCDDTIVGFYGLCPLPDDGATWDVTYFFIDPPAIGRGVGRALWRDMLTVAHRHGVQYIEVVSDPNALGFYRRMGAEPTGDDEPSPVDPNRCLPILRIRVD